MLDKKSERPEKITLTIRFNLYVSQSMKEGIFCQYF